MLKYLINYLSKTYPKISIQLDCAKAIIKEKAVQTFSTAS